MELNGFILDRGEPGGGEAHWRRESCSFIKSGGGGGGKKETGGEEEEEEEEEEAERKWETGHWTDVSRPEALPVTGTKWADTIICRDQLTLNRHNFQKFPVLGKTGTPSPHLPPPPSVSMRQGPRGESSQNCHLLRDGFIKSILWNNLSWQSADRGQRCHPRQFRRRPPSAPSNWGQFQPNFVASVSRFLSSRFTFHWILPHRLHLASLIVNNRLPSNQKPPSFPYEILSPANEFLH